MEQSQKIIPLEESIVYIDGRFCKASEAGLSPFDHGLLYGDGVFDSWINILIDFTDRQSI